MAIEKILPTQLHDGLAFLPKHSVLLYENNTVLDIVPMDQAGDDIKIIDGMVCPGLVNAHCHTELSHMYNNIRQGTGMVDFLLGVIGNRNATNETIEATCATAIQKMEQEGIVAVGDICNTTHSITAKKNSTIAFKNFIEVAGFIPSVAKNRLDEGQQVADTFLQNGLNASLVPHAPYSVSQALFNQIAEDSSSISLHYLESDAELYFIKNGTGDFTRLFNNLQIKTDFVGYGSIAAFNAVLNKFKNLLLVHNVHITLDDIEQLQHTATSLCLCICPKANLYIGNPLPDLDLLLNSNATICLGTDSLASNNSLSIIEEMATIQKYYPTIPAETLIKWATYNGAKALGVDDTFGSFEKGKDAKYVVLANALT